MSVVVVAVIFTLILCGFAFRANIRFADRDRLPMQWWLTGEVTWSAPRKLALAFIPALAIGLFAFYVVASFTLEPRRGQEALALPTLVGIGAMFVAIQLLHFWLTAKTLRRSDR